MPTSTPLRAIAVRTGEPGTSAAQSSASLAKTIARLRKNWPLPAMNQRTSGFSIPSAASVSSVPLSVRWCASSPIASDRTISSCRSSGRLSAVRSSGASTSRIHVSRSSTSGPSAP